MALEYLVSKDGNPWEICDGSNASTCDGLAGNLNIDGLLIGTESKAPYTFSSTEIQIGDVTPLSGYKVGARFYTQIPGGVGPDGQPIPPTRTYPEFRIVSQTFEYNGRRLFQTNTGDEFFGASTGDVIAAGTYAEAGITDGTEYAYGLVFDESEILYLPRLSTSSQSPCTDNIPEEPYDDTANPPIYPIDAILAFTPDERDSVTVEFKMTTVYENPTNNNQETSVIIVQQTVTQPLGYEDYAEKIEALQEMSYFGNGYEHIGLYPPQDAPGFDLPVFDETGDLVSGKVNEPINIKQLTRKSYPFDIEKMEWPQYPEKDCA